MRTAAMRLSSWRSKRSTARIGSRRRSISTRVMSADRAGIMHRALRLTIDRSALQANWRWLQERAGVPAGAAIKADGYGLGARETMLALYEVGCRDFFVSTWAEAEELGPVPDESSLIVLHGVAPDDADAALSPNGRPCLNSVEQVARWRGIAPG